MALTKEERQKLDETREASLLTRQTVVDFLVPAVKSNTKKITKLQITVAILIASGLAGGGTLVSILTRLLNGV